MDKNTIIETAEKLMAKADTAYLATIDEKGFPQIRAMLNLLCTDGFPKQSDYIRKNRNGLSTYFTTNTSSRKIPQIKKNVAASVYYNIGYEGLLLIGNLEIVEGDKVKRAFWEDSWKMYYTKGLDDPDHTILKFTPSTLKLYGNFKVTEISL